MGLHDDIRARLPDLEIGLIFDIGANVGDTVARFRHRYPGATIHAFEPVLSTYRTLAAKMRDDAGVRCHNTALSRASRQVTISAKANGKKNRILQGAGADTGANATVQTVTTETGDRFCSTNGIDRIDFLKIDTEGHDLEVLAGFEGMLGAGNVGIVQIEVGMSKRNTLHVNIAEAIASMYGQGYDLFRIYEQKFNGNGLPIGQRADLVFVSDRLIGPSRPQ